MATLPETDYETFSHKYLDRFVVLQAHAVHLLSQAELVSQFLVSEQTVQIYDILCTKQLQVWFVLIQ